MDIFVLHPERIALVAVLLVAAELILARGWRPSRKLADHGLMMAAAIWLLYALWELLILVQSPEANIRVDLLLILPLALIAIAVGIFLEARRSRRASTH